jgi:predicted CxxxxCH...CXXCH cytochrome family protein
MRTVRAAWVVGPLAAVVVVASGCGGQEQGRTATDTAAVAQDPPLCTPDAHAKHAAVTSCTTCHVVGGLVEFDPSGAAVSPVQPPPVFDAKAKTCSNVACHGVPAGTYSYSFPGGDGQPVAKTVSYGGTSFVTPSWYFTGIGCTACHGNPPKPAAGVWHTGMHGNIADSIYNACELCHPDAISQNGAATGLNPATDCGPNGTYGVCAQLHANGTVDVWPRWDSSCFGCH